MLLSAVPELARLTVKPPSGTFRAVRSRTDALFSRLASDTLSRVREKSTSNSTCRCSMASASATACSRARCCCVLMFCTCASWYPSRGVSGTASPFMAIAVPSSSLREASTFPNVCDVLVALRSFGGGNTPVEAAPSSMVSRMSIFRARTPERNRPAEEYRAASTTWVSSLISSLRLAMVCSSLLYVNVSLRSMLGDGKISTLWRSVPRVFCRSDAMNRTPRARYVLGETMESASSLRCFAERSIWRSRMTSIHHLCNFVAALNVSMYRFGSKQVHVSVNTSYVRKNSVRLCMSASGRLRYTTSTWVFMLDTSTSAPWRSTRMLNVSAKASSPIS
eukprot:PhM_4_TR2695/c0_g2_i1/m.63648